MAAGAAEGDGQIALAFADVVRQQIDQQLRDAVDEFDGLRKRPDVARHAGVAAGQLLELRNVVRVGQKADVEDQVAIGGHAVTVAEAGHVDHDLRFFALAHELLADEIAQLVNRELRGIDGQVRQLADGREHLALLADALADGLAGAERMRPARLAEAAHDRLVVRLHERSGAWESRAGCARRSRESRLRPWPSRMSTTRAAKRMDAESRVSSANLGIRPMGRLSTE